MARDKLLMYSEPFANGLFNATRNYVPFVSPITAVEVTSGGVWVCADQTYWLAGADIAAAQLDAKLPYGAVPGSAGTEPNTNNVFWMSPRGLVRAGQDGSIKNLQEEHVAVPAAGFAACYFEEHDGQKRIGASQFDVGSNRMAAASYMDAEVVRKGVVL